MDGSHFDTFARTLNNPGSRRGVLATLLGATLGLTGWRGYPDAALARKHKKHKKKHRVASSPPPPTSPPPISCPTGYTNCANQCFDLSDNPQNCGTCAVVCSPGKACCGGVCTNTQDDDNNCGSCGNQCLPSPVIARPHGAICVNGTCEQCGLQGSFPPGNGLSGCCRGLVLCQRPTGQNSCDPPGTPC
jgi:Stigma-specific protein, Stig1